MSGHAILDSCHNCGKKNLNLNIVATDTGCPGYDGIKHIHVFVACDDCKKKIWNQ